MYDRIFTNDKGCGVRKMRFSKLFFLLLVVLLMMFPVSVYAAMDHSGHDMGGEIVPSEDQSQNEQNNSLNETHSQHNMETDNSVSSGQGNDMSGHSMGDTKKNILEPVKNEILAGFLVLNVIIVTVAFVMRKKYRRGGVNPV